MKHRRVVLSAIENIDGVGRVVQTSEGAEGINRTVRHDELVPGRVPA